MTLLRTTKHFSLRRKIALVAVAITVLNVATMIGYNAHQRFREAEVHGLSVAQSAAQQAASEVTSHLSLAMRVARTNADALVQMHKSGLRDRTQVNAWFQGALQSHPDLFAMYNAWEPNAFDGRDAAFAGRAALGSTPQGRFMAYPHWAAGSVAIEPLVDFDKPGVGDWYLIPRSTLQPAVLDPYVYPVGDEQVLMTSLVHPLVVEGKFLGVSGVDLTMAQLQRALADIRPFGTGHVALYTASGLLVAGPDASQLGKRSNDAHLSPALMAEVAAGAQKHFVYEGTSRTLLPLPIDGVQTRWVLDVQIPQTLVMADALRVRDITIVIGLLFIVLDALLIRWVVMRQTLPLEDLRQAVGRMVEDLNRTGTEIGLPLNRQDEIGQLARTFESLRMRVSDSISSLEDNVAHRTEQLSKTLEQLKRTQTELIQSEKLAALGGLVAGVAHELNTPLGNSLTTASAFFDQAKDVNQAHSTGNLRRSQLNEFLENSLVAADLIQRNAHRAADLITSFKQVAVDQTSNKQRKFVLKNVVGDAVAMVAPSFKHQPVRIQQSVEHGIVLDSFPGSLEQVLTNLIQNSVVHGLGDKSGLQISISACVCEDTEPPSILLTYQDDGVGMTSDTLKHAFDPFFTTRFGTGGSGLGLFLVYNIVHSILQGHIELESSPGLGTTFRLTLPLHIALRT